jgi:hypothetical protein
MIVTTSNMTLDGGEWPSSLHGRFVTGKSPLLQLNIRAGGPHSHYGGFGEGKNLSHAED